MQEMPPLLQLAPAIVGVSGLLPSPPAPAADEARRSDHDREGDRRWPCLVDLCGLGVASLVYVVAASCALLVNVYVVVPRMDGLLTMLHCLGYNFCILLLLVSHARCACTNPGTARDYLDQDFVSAKRAEHLQVKAEASLGLDSGLAHAWCEKCDIYKPRRAHHCSTCRACVLEMDHHCPWVNNCVGWRNHKYFLQFLASAWTGLGWTAVALVYGLSTPPEPMLLLPGDSLVSFDGGHDSGVLSVRSWGFGPLHRSINAQMCCVVCCVACGLLFIFASVMAFDQWEYLAQGHGIVDKKKLALKQQADSIEVGVQYEVRQTLQIRTGESLESQELGVLQKGSLARVTDKGLLLRRRVCVAAQDGSAGWISAVTASGQRLLYPVVPSDGGPSSPATASCHSGFFHSDVGQRLVAVMDGAPSGRWLLPLAPSANSGLYAAPQGEEIAAEQQQPLLKVPSQVSAAGTEREAAFGTPRGSSGSLAAPDASQALEESVDAPGAGCAGADGAPSPPTLRSSLARRLDEAAAACSPEDLVRAARSEVSAAGLGPVSPARALAGLKAASEPLLCIRRLDSNATSFSLDAADLSADYL